MTARAGTGEPHAATLAQLPKVASRIVSELLGVDVLEAERLHEGMMTFKCRVSTQRGDDIIVRFYPAGRSSVVHQEPDLLVRCLRSGIAVPQPIGDSRTGPPSPLAYVAYRRIAGITLQERLRREGEQSHEPLARKLALTLCQLREVGFQGSGELVSATAAEDEGWETFVQRSLVAGFEAVRQNRLLAEPVVQDIARVMQRMPDLRWRETGRLVWGDFNFGNVLVDEGQSHLPHVVGLIDFEGCLSGDALATLGYGFAAHGTRPFFAWLLRAWPSPLSEDDHDLIALYAVLRALRLARYAHLPLPTGRARDSLIDIFPGIQPALQRLTRQR